ncbi:MAG: hypothetical protein D6679_04800 [Candidatus Hydrogenedentota bacterium]|nr:MAG: hypothetical protein D6679_04800 [Candidatus Hydrogenedentota bacterium]
MTAVHAAQPFTIETTDVDNAQVGVPYAFTFRANGSIALGGVDGGENWSLGGSAATLASYGLTLDAATGVLSGTPTRAVKGLLFGITADTPGGGQSDGAVYSITIVGLLDFDSGPLMGVDTSVEPGATDVEAAQFRMVAHGEDIEIKTLKFHGLGSGSDTFDISLVKLYRDSNANGRIDGGDPLLASGNYVVSEGFNPTITFSNIGYKITWDSNTPDTNGIADFLIGYDFKATVEPARTFRVAFESIDDIDWDGLTSGLGYKDGLGGGDQFSLNQSVVTNFIAETVGFKPPYRGPVLTVAGTVPLQPTLFVTNNGFLSDSQNALTESETTALEMIFYSDSGHTIILDEINIFDSGTGTAFTHIKKAQLYVDIDKNGVLTAVDGSSFASATFSGDKVTFSNLNISVQTPTGLATDPAAVHLLLTYTFENDVPIINPPLTFQAYIPSGTEISAHEQVTTNPASIVMPILYGNVLAIVDSPAVAGGTGDGPFPDSAVWYDNDTNGYVSQGDTILVLFDTNLASNSSATVDDLVFPVVGDNVGNGASISFPGGNRMIITLGASPILTIPGTFQNANKTAGSPSGINLKNSVPTIVSVNGKTAVAAQNNLDIDSATITSSSTASASQASSSGDTTTGDKVCLARRATANSEVLENLRLFRDLLLDSWFGRIATRFYYFLSNL